MSKYDDNIKIKKKNDSFLWEATNLLAHYGIGS